jgi:hypothetical protein
VIPFTLVYQKDETKKLVPVSHHVIPRVGEKVFPPGEPHQLTVLTVDHDLDTHAIWVVLN